MRCRSVSSPPENISLWWVLFVGWGKGPDKDVRKKGDAKWDKGTRGRAQLKAVGKEEANPSSPKPNNDPSNTVVFVYGFGYGYEYRWN